MSVYRCDNCRWSGAIDDRKETPTWCPMCAERLLGECGWSDCDNPAIAWRWTGSRLSGSPVCGEHTAEAEKQRAIDERLRAERAEAGDGEHDPDHGDAIDLEELG